MYKSFSDLNIISTRGRDSQKKARLVEAAKKVMDNKHAEILMMEDQNTEYANKLMQESLNSIKMANHKNKRQSLSEKMNYRENLKNDLFASCISDIVYNALLIDESVKEDMKDNLHQFTSNVVKNYMNENHITYRQLKNKTELLESLVNLCENTARKESDNEFDIDNTDKEILNELDNETKKGTKKDMGQESKDEFDSSKENITDKLSAEIKETVIDTLQQEKEKAKELEEEQNEIKDTIETLETYADDDMATSATGMTGGEENIPSDSSDLGIENTPQGPTGKVTGPATEPEEVKLVDESFVQSLKLTRNKKRPVHSVFGTFMNEYSKRLFLAESSILEPKMNIDMNKVMAKSIISYTILETMSALEIVNKDRKSLDNLSKVIMNIKM